MQIAPYNGPSIGGRCHHPCHGGLIIGVRRLLLLLVLLVFPHCGAPNPCPRRVHYSCGGGVGRDRARLLLSHTGATLLLQLLQLSQNMLRLLCIIASTAVAVRCPCRCRRARRRLRGRPHATTNAKLLLLMLQLSQKSLRLLRIIASIILAAQWPGYCRRGRPRFDDRLFTAITPAKSILCCSVLLDCPNARPGTVIAAPMLVLSSTDAWLQIRNNDMKTAMEIAVGLAAMVTIRLHMVVCQLGQQHCPPSFIVAASVLKAHRSR